MDVNSLGVGVDIEDIERFKKYAKDEASSFLKRVYTPKEIEYCFKSANPEKHLAARFCAKEAIYKAFCSVGVMGLKFQDVEIINDSARVPRVNFLTDRLDGYSCKISLSHGKDNAVASVIVVKN